jgi:hypothetical protein
LVGHHPTNKLIGRGPIPHRKSFPPHTMQCVVLSGIRPSFPSLSRSAGQITHVLLTRSPLEHPASRAFPFDLHVLSTPPAFVLSQDQTLQTKTPHPQQAGKNSNQNNLTRQKDTKNWHQQNKTTPPTREVKSMAKKTTTKTKPPNTLLSSQTTPVFGQPCHCTPRRMARQLH